MTLKAKRAQLLQTANAIANGAKALDRALSAEEETKIKALIDEIKSIDEQIADGVKSDQLAAELASFGAPEGDEAPKSTGVKAKSIGGHFIKSIREKGASLKTPGTLYADEVLLSKAATDTQAVGGHTGAFGPLVVDLDKDFVHPPKQRLVVADLMGSGSVSGNAIQYPVFGALEGGTGMVGEGGTKPQLHVTDPTWVTDALGEAAGWFKLTDDMAEDLDYVVSEINTTALYDLALKEEQQLLNGNGTAPNVRGLLNRSGVQSYSVTTESDADGIFHALTLAQEASGFVADAIVINPQDYEKIRLSKDGNGQYYAGGYFTGQYGNGDIMVNPPLWGRKTVVTTAIEAGTVLVGAFSTAKVFRKGGVRVESTNSNVDDFINDKITVRVRERFGLQVKYPAAFVKVTLKP